MTSSTSCLAAKLRDKGHVTLGPGCLRVLLALLRLSVPGHPPPSMEELCAEVGMHMNAVWRHLNRLREAGMLTQAGGAKSRTIRPTVRLELVEAEQ